jgi:hypothetical protein
VLIKTPTLAVTCNLITEKMPKLFGTRFAIRDGIIVISRSGS